MVSMMVGGISRLPVQMLRPSVLDNMSDHPNFCSDRNGRLRRTARFIAVENYADREFAQATMARVHIVHDHSSGTLPDRSSVRPQRWRRFCRSS